MALATSINSPLNDFGEAWRGEKIELQSIGGIVTVARRGSWGERKDFEGWVVFRFEGSKDSKDWLYLVFFVFVGFGDSKGWGVACKDEGDSERQVNESTDECPGDSERRVIESTDECLDPNDPDPNDKVPLEKLFPKASVCLKSTSSVNCGPCVAGKVWARVNAASSCIANVDCMLNVDWMLVDW